MDTMDINIEYEDPLDCFIEKMETKPEQNPFYVSTKETLNKIVFVNPLKDLQKDINTLNATRIPIKRVFVMCVKDGHKIPNEIYDELITYEKLIDACKHFNLIKCSMKILKTKSHMQTVSIIGKKVLEHIDCIGGDVITFNEFELIIPMFEISGEAARTYVSMYKDIEHDFGKLRDVINMKKYFNASFKLSFDFVENILNDYFWRYKTGEFNMSKCISKRKLKKFENTDMNNVQMDYQFNGMNRSQSCNVYSAIKDAPRRSYYVGDPEYKQVGISKDDVARMFANISDNRSLYNMFNAFAVSRLHCHLVVNNKPVMNMMAKLFERYQKTYSYVLSYPMMALYIEECMIGIRTRKSNRYIFTIDTAHEFPVFPFTPDNVRLSPYNILPVPSNFFTENLYGLKFINGYKHYGIDTLSGFRTKFNLFTTRTPDKNTFDGIDWKFLAVTGSTIPACVPTRSPLVDTVAKPSGTPNENYLAFFDAYYGNSDIDIICTAPTQKDFALETYKLFVQVKKNLGMTPEDSRVIVTPVKLARLFVSRNKLNEMIDELCIKNPEITEISNVERHLNDNAIIQRFFYDKYVHAKTTKNKDIKSENIMEEQHNELCTIDHFKVCLVTYNIQNETGASECIYMETVPHPDNPNLKTVSLKIEDTIRYKISDNPQNAPEVKYLTRPFEVFRSRDAHEPYSTIARFHLPCVRGYYDGTNVYMTPSCVMSHLTLMNLDYNYFAGSAQPIEIVLKYLKRGYGTYLNASEIHYVKYYDGLNITQDVLMRQKPIVMPLIDGKTTIQPNYFVPSVQSSDTSSAINAVGNVEPFNPEFCEIVWKNTNEINK